MNTINQLDLADIYSTFYLTTEEYAYYSNAYETFIKVDSVLDY